MLSIKIRQKQDGTICVRYSWDFFFKSERHEHYTNNEEVTKKIATLLDASQIKESHETENTIRY